MSDPITLAKQREEADRLPFIAVQEFRVDYEPQPDGSQRPVEWVAWAKKGVQNPAIIEEKVSRLMRQKDDPVWQVIEPYYKRWKDNQSAPVDGTPLAAWPGATPQLVKALEPANIRSVEDLARMEDSAISRISIPGLREKQKHTRAYIDAQISTSSVAAENLKLKESVEAQAREIAELRKYVESLQEDDEPEVAPRRRGRPPKNLTVVS